MDTSAWACSILFVKTSAFAAAELAAFLALSTFCASAFASAASEARVIFCGEEHTNQLQHQMQLEVIKAVDAQNGSPTLIGLEMCWRLHQPALDAFVFGDGDFAKLAARTRWKGFRMPENDLAYF